MGIVTTTVARVAATGEVEAVYRQDGDRLWRSVYAFAGNEEVASAAVAEAFAQAYLWLATGRRLDWDEGGGAASDQPHP
jgi:hypothetical protein